MMESLCLTEEMVDCTLTAGRTSFSAHRMVSICRIVNMMIDFQTTGVVHLLTLLSLSLCLGPFPSGEFTVAMLGDQPPISES